MKNRISYAINQSGKAFIEIENGKLTGGFLYELRDLMKEYEIEKINNGKIVLIDDVIEMENCTFEYKIVNLNKKTLSCKINDNTIYIKE